MILLISNVQNLPSKEILSSLGKFVDLTRTCLAWGSPDMLGRTILYMMEATE